MRATLRDACALWLWGTQTLIAGLSQTAFIAPWVMKGAMDGPAFATYVRDVLIPEI